MPQDTFAASRTPRSAEESAPDLRKGRRMAWFVAWASIALAIVAGLTEAAGGVGFRLRWWGAGTGIYTLGIGALAAAAASVIALAALFIAWLSGLRRTMAAAGIGLLLGALLAAPPIYLWRRAATLPQIHDISTDTENPPRFNAVLARRAGAENGVEYSADVAAQQKAAYPDVTPMLMPQSPARAFDLADRAARDMGWEIVAVSPPDLRIEATATTALFGFEDDVVVRIMPAAKGSRVDVRSVSRIGKSDIGANASRIRAYLKKLADLGRTEG